MIVAQASSLFLSPELGKGDVVAHGEEAHEADEEEREEGGEAGMGSGDHEEPIEQAAGNAGHRVDLFLEDERFFVEEYVAYDAACRSGDASHDDGDPDGMSAIERLLESGDGEEGESEGVEDEPGVVEALERTGEDDDEDLREGGADEVERRGHPERGDAEHQVADGAASDGYGHTTDEAAKPVEMLGCGVPDAGDGKGEGAEKLYDLLYYFQRKSNIKD